MNTVKVTEIINNELEAYRKSIRYTRQHAASKKHLARLEELGILQHMPAKFGNSDAQHIIQCAENSGKTTSVFNAYGEGETVDMQPHALYLAINEVETPEPAKTETSKEIRKGDKVRVLAHVAYQHLSQGAVISPMVEHDREGYETTVVGVYKEMLEDEYGNDIVEYQIEVETGEIFSPEQIERLS